MGLVPDGDVPWEGACCFSMENDADSAGIWYFTLSRFKRGEHLLQQLTLLCRATETCGVSLARDVSPSTHAIFQMLGVESPPPLRLQVTKPGFGPGWQ